MNKLIFKIFILFFLIFFIKIDFVFSNTNVLSNNLQVISGIVYKIEDFKLTSYEIPFYLPLNKIKLSNKLKSNDIRNIFNQNLTLNLSKIEKPYFTDITCIDSLNTVYQTKTLKNGFFNFNINGLNKKQCIKLIIENNTLEIVIEPKINYGLKIYTTNKSNIEVYSFKFYSKNFNFKILQKDFFTNIKKRNSFKTIEGICGKIKNSSNFKNIKLNLNNKNYSLIDKNKYFEIKDKLLPNKYTLNIICDEKLTKTAEIIINKQALGYFLNNLVIDLNNSPIIQNINILGNSNEILIEYDVYDKDSDECKVTSLEYSIDNGKTFLPVLKFLYLGDKKGFFNYSYTKTIKWYSKLDIKNNVDNVILLLRLTDGKTEVTNKTFPFLVKNNTLPVISNINIIGESDEITIHYDLFDNELNTCSIQLAYSIDNLPFKISNNIYGDINFVAPLQNRTMVWKSRNDFKVSSSNVRLKFYIFDGFNQVEYVYPKTLNITNNYFKPEIKINNVNGNSNEIKINYKLLDSDENDCKIKLYYSLGLNNFKESNAIIDNINNIKPNSNLFIKWNSYNDIKVDTDDVYIKLIAYDGTYTSESNILGPISIYNNSLPEIKNILCTKTLPKITIWYELLDKEQDTCSIECFYSLDNVYFTKIDSLEIEGILDNVLPNLKHSITWNTLHSLNGNYEKVYFKIIPIQQINKKYGNGAITTLFDINNNYIPQVSNINCIGDSNEITISFDLIDKNNHNCTIEVYYSVDLGKKFQKTNNIVLSEKKLKPGINKQIIWNSKLDVLTSEPNVLIKIIPFDDYSKGISGLSSSFRVLNNTPPIINNIKIIGNSKKINIYYDLIDNNECDITFYYCIKNDKRFIKSKNIVGDIAKVKPGTNKQIIWNSYNDLPYNTEVIIKILAFDGNLESEEYVSQPFVLRNNTPPQIEIVSYEFINKNLKINYKLLDNDKDDIIHIKFYYSKKDKNKFNESIFLSGDVKNLISDNKIKSLIWNTTEDIQEKTEVYIKLVAYDKYNTQSNEYIHGPILISNEDVPKIKIFNIKSINNHEFRIDFEILNLNTTCSVELYYSLDKKEFLNENKAKQVTYIDNGNNKYSLIWDITYNVLTNENNKIFLKLVPYLNGYYGGADYLDNISAPKLLYQLQNVKDILGRANHTCVTFKDYIYIIGGWIGSPTYINDIVILKYDLSLDSLEVKINYNQLVALRHSHTSVVFNNKIYVLGGIFNQSKNDVWCSVDGNNWEELTKNETEAVKFTPRNLHDSVVFNDGLGEKIFIIGGFGNGYKNDVWCSVTGKTWSLIKEDAEFSPRIGHKLVVFNNMLYLIGGYDGTYYKNDVWCSKDGIIWHLITNEANFSKRANHSLVNYDNRIWLIGGNDEKNCFNDIWYSTNGKDWFKIITNLNNNEIFTPRYSHTILNYKNKLILFGGYDKLDYKNDIWVIK